MPQYLDPTGRSSYGIALCGRCGEKFYLDELMPDPNTPGLMVCRADRDDYDPYRLPARQSENISLLFTRPDLPLTDHEAPEPQLAFALTTEDNEYILTEGGDYIWTEEALDAGDNPWA